MEGKKLNTQLKNSTILLEYPSVVNRKTRLVIVFENCQICLIFEKSCVGSRNNDDTQEYSDTNMYNDVNVYFVYFCSVGIARKSCKNETFLQFCKQYDLLVMNGTPKRSLYKKVKRKIQKENFVELARLAYLSLFS